jgi:hypothetical protein
MAHLRRWLFSGIAALSLLMLVATVIVWIRSEFVYDTFWEVSHDPKTGNLVSPMVVWDDGRLLLTIRITHFKNPRGLDRPWTHPSVSSYVNYPHGPQKNGMSNVRWLWFYRGDQWTTDGPRISEYRLIVRIWIIAALLSVAPVVFVWLVKRGRMRRTQGFCQQCGYDLRTTPDRCPECGAISPKL